VLEPHFGNGADKGRWNVQLGVTRVVHEPGGVGSPLIRSGWEVKMNAD